jgi:HTH-type transcriptional regulator / antitoxin HigA
MDVRPIKTEADYEWALAEIERYFETQPEPGTADGDRFDVLADLIEAYENRNWPVAAATPVETLRAFMEIRGLQQADLAALLGSKSRASEVLSGERGLSLEMIRRISSSWHIPADALIGEGTTASDAA